MPYAPDEMRQFRSAAAALLLVAAVPAAVAADQRNAPATKGAAPRLVRYQVAAGTALLLEMRTPLDSATALVDDQVEAVLWSPIVQDGVELIPEGSVAIGRVREIVRAAEKSPVGSLTVTFTIVEHAETRSRATLNTQNVVFTAPAPEPQRGRFKRRPKPVDVAIRPGSRLVAVTAIPLTVWIPRPTQR